MDRIQLDEILRKHKIWLDTSFEKEKCANLSSADLSDTNLMDTDLRRANLRGADLNGANLRGADLRDADLRGADLRGADLRGANLRYADLRSANLSDTNLSYSITDKKYISISCIGPRRMTITYCFEDNYIWCVGFQGTLKKFENQIKKTHSNNKKYLTEYLGFIEYIKKLKSE